jgi:23S rRNA pseudouridine2605 synthase/16S rRNA pseudouridine516 synthase
MPGKPPHSHRIPEDAPADLTDASRGVRIQKVLAAAGVASRRHCEELVLAGRVMVNGQQVTALPAWVDPYTDRIEVNGCALPRPGGRARQERRGDAETRGRGESKTGARGAAEGQASAHPTAFVPAGRLYVMLNKPRRVVSTGHDPEGRRTVADLVQLEGAEGPVRLYPVGRLDADSTGLILLTNDGELTHRLTHARYGVPKTYLVSVKGVVSAETVHRLKRMLGSGREQGTGLGREPWPSGNREQEAKAEGGRPKAEAGQHVRKAAVVEQVTMLGAQHDQSRGDRTNLRITLFEGQNREIRDLLARLGLKVRRLQRIGVGPLRLKGLGSGHWRLLTREEVHGLRHAAGLR